MVRKAVPLEILHGPHFVGPGMTNPNSRGSGPDGDMFAGRTTIDSGAASVTVSTNIVNSDSLIFFGSEVASVGLDVQSGGGVVVNSISSGISFAFARPTGVAVPWDETVMWMVFRGS